MEMKVSLKMENGTGKYNENGTRNRWSLKKQPAKEELKALARQLNGNEIVASLLLQRGIRTQEEAKRFFRPDLSDLHDPFLMKDMDAAVARVERALLRKEKILVYGDYDVDGTTAVALVYTHLVSLGADCGFYIPDRYAEGYGISFAGIDFAKENGFTLIIALDCGIKSNDKIAYAKGKNIDFIICDHHRPGAELPGAVAVLDPKRNDCHYPYDELCGCGIGFKLMQALTQKKGGSVEMIEPLLDLVAVAIAADIVPLTGENRVLATFGMKRINSAPRPGFRAMTELVNVKRKLSISDVVFLFAPRINAAGRVEHGKLAVELLASDDEASARRAAEIINRNNTERRELDRQITIHALDMISSDAAFAKRRSTVVFDSTWHKGVVGIVASRLIEKHYRPTIVLCESNGKVSGSARSVKDFDIYEAIEACSDLLIQFGGHKYAAGLTLEKQNVDAFIEKFEAEVSARITEAQLVPEIEIDAEISFSQIDNQLLNTIRLFAPFGPGNMNPVFLTRHVCDRGWARVVKDSHLKLDLIDPRFPTRIFPAIAFGLAEKLPLLANKNEIDAVYTLEENEWNGKVSLQLNVKDVKRFVNGN
ncbi:MAG TPA: single-stranded-DNA-specific exonuclease RecJ [Bacteroidia bacterium]|nr:single-stranded-DNA-specific exonuclease RecJ [Bacteroidia bacterium]